MYKSYVYWTVNHCNSWRIKDHLMSLAILFHFLCAQHVSDINISIIKSLRLFCWITTLVVLFLVRCVLEFRCGWVGVVSVLQAEAACNTETFSPFFRSFSANWFTQTSQDLQVEFLVNCLPVGSVRVVLKPSFPRFSMLTVVQSGVRFQRRFYPL